MEDALSELLKGLQSTNAIPIIDGKNNIEAIVTSYDTAEYFRRRAEDLMLAEDIELNLRDFIKPSNASDTSNADDDKISQLIEAITPSNNDLKAKFKSALLSYIAKTTGNKPKLDHENFDSVFEQYLARPVVQRTFDDLTLYELTQIFKKLWSQYQSGFNDLEWDAIEPLLDGIRETRNAIAHFREVSPQQRKQLQYCVSLLNNHKPSFELPEAELITIEATNSLSASETLLPEAHSFSPLEEEVEANDSRYAPLAIWLQTQEADRITCTFKEIEAIIQDDLPPSARQYRTWWANNTVGNTQSTQWLDVDWRVSSVNMAIERIVFSRMGERQSAYIDFFWSASGQPQIYPRPIHNTSEQPTRQILASVRDQTYRSSLY